MFSTEQCLYSSMGMALMSSIALVSILFPAMFVCRDTLRMMLVSCFLGVLNKQYIFHGLL